MEKPKRIRRQKLKAQLLTVQDGKWKLLSPKTAKKARGIGAHVALFLCDEIEDEDVLDFQTFYGCIQASPIRIMFTNTGQITYEGEMARLGYNKLC